MVKILSLIIFLSLLISINYCNTRDFEFSKEKWKMIDHNYPSRLQMFKDLTKNQKLVGLKYSELIKLLGEPNVQSDYFLSYKLSVRDPFEFFGETNKYLGFNFSKDSTICQFQYYEFKS